jgi:hypothetical protein
MGEFPILPFLRLLTLALSPGSYFTLTASK